MPVVPDSFGHARRDDKVQYISIHMWASWGGLCEGPDPWRDHIHFSVSRTRQRRVDIGERAGLPFCRSEDPKTHTTASGFVWSPPLSLLINWIVE